MLLNVSTACCPNYLHQSSGYRRKQGPGWLSLPASSLDYWRGSYLEAAKSHVVQFFYFTVGGENKTRSVLRDCLGWFHPRSPDLIHSFRGILDFEQQTRKEEGGNRWCWLKEGKDGWPWANMTIGPFMCEGVISPNPTWFQMPHSLKPRASHLIFVTVFLSCWLRGKRQWSG